MLLPKTRSVGDSVNLNARSMRPWEGGIIRRRYSRKAQSKELKLTEDYN